MLIYFMIIYSVLKIIFTKMSNYYNKYWQLIIQNENSNPKI